MTSSTQNDTSYAYAKQVITEWFLWMDEVMAAKGQPKDYDLPQASLRWLTYCTEHFAEGVIEYLSQEPEHFKQLEERSEDPLFVRQVADKIYQYSDVWELNVKMLNASKKGEKKN
jgi:hypothetical protein